MCIDDVYKCLPQDSKDTWRQQQQMRGQGWLHSLGSDRLHGQPLLVSPEKADVYTGPYGTLSWGLVVPFIWGPSPGGLLGKRGGYVDT